MAGIRLVAVDMDGTILERGQVIRPPLVAAFQALREHGVSVTTATGRPLDFQVSILAAHGLGAAAGVPQALMADERELFLLSGGGRSRIASPIPAAVPAGPTLSGLLPSGLARRTPDGSRGVRPAYVAHDAWNRAVRTRWKTLCPVALAWLSRAVAETGRRGWTCEPHDSVGVASDRGLPGLRSETVEQAAALRKWLAGELAREEPRLAVNRNGCLVQLQDAAVGKGNVLVELTRLCLLQPTEVLCAGDSANDLSMLDGRLGFQAAAPGNADAGIKDAVRRAGGYVAEAPAGAGVLEALAHHGLPIL